MESITEGGDDERPATGRRRPERVSQEQSLGAARPCGAPASSPSCAQKAPLQSSFLPECLTSRIECLPAPVPKLSKSGTNTRSPQSPQLISGPTRRRAATGLPAWPSETLGDGMATSGGGRPKDPGLEAALVTRLARDLNRARQPRPRLSERGHSLAALRFHELLESEKARESRAASSLSSGSERSTLPSPSPRDDGSPRLNSPRLRDSPRLWQTPPTPPAAPLTIQPVRVPLAAVPEPPRRQRRHGRLEGFDRLAATYRQQLDARGCTPPITRSGGTPLPRHEGAAHAGTI